MKTAISWLMTAALFATVASPVSTALAQGSLTPPGAPAPTMRTLLQIEPRAPISSLPFTITNPGAWFVTTNLTGVPNANGITIATSNVVLDLRGFTLTGVPGSSNGVYLAGNYAATVENGTLTAWALAGVDADNGQGCRFSQLNLAANGSDGLDPGRVSQVLDCLATGNTGDGFGGFCSNSKFERCTGTENDGQGFSTFEGCSVVECSASLNGLDGFTCFVHCTVQGCVAHDNGFDGIDMPYSGGGGVVASCVCNNNGSAGILTADGFAIKDCAAGGNGQSGISTGSGSVIESSSAGNNQGPGISAGNGCVISGCSSWTNSGSSSVGITAGNASEIRNCVAAANALNGIVVSNACFVEHNLCAANGGGGATDGGILCLGGQNRIDDNHLTGNNGNGLYLNAAGNKVVRNTADGNSGTNYSVGAGNDVGPIGSAAASTSPWANLQ
jgi:hypothetical protein